MPITRTTRTSARKPTIMDKLRNRHRTSNTSTRANRHGGTTTTTTTTTKTTKTTHNPTRRTGATTATHHHKRRPSMKDKVSGAMLKLKGTVTRRPGQKAAGTRRMHGTDGRGSHHRTY